MCLAACGAAGPSGDDPPEVPRGWTRYTEQHGLFDVALPPRSSLAQEAFPGAVDSYWYWSPELGGGTFSVALGDARPDPIDTYLASERSRPGASVDVDADDVVSWRGTRARHLRVDTDYQTQGSLDVDPSTGLTHHVEAGDVHETADFHLWRGRTKAIRVGYRVERDAESSVERTFIAMVESFRLRRPLP